jgi:WD40 repeat protein
MGDSQDEQTGAAEAGAGPERRLERLWQAGERPEVRAFLARAGPCTAAQLAAVLRVDQRERWRRGERTPAEAYLQLYGEFHTDPEYALDLVFGEFVLRQELDSATDVGVVADRFPQLGSQLRQQVEFLRALDAAGAADRAAAGDASTLPSSSLPAAPGAAEEAPPEALLAPGYEVLELIGQGGMGVVYKALQLKPRRLVALKSLRGEGAGRLLGEAEAAARLRHPNVVQVYEVGEHAGRPYLAMEFVEGGSLEQKLAAGPPPPREAAALVRALARAMHHAHRQHVIHRDLKPANVLLAEDGTPKIADFGLAKRLDVGPGPTRSGVVLGTAAYMAPEQALGRTREVGPLTDVYGLGAILYECLAGRPPFEGTTLVLTLHRVACDEPTPPRRLRRGVPADLETICLKCLRKEPEKRYASAEALAADLGAFLEGRSIQARPSGPVERTVRWARRSPLAAGLLAALLLVGGAGLAAVTWKWLDAEAARQAATQKEEDERTQRRIAEDARGRLGKQAADLETQAEELQTTLYQFRIALAHHEWSANNLIRAGELLPECPEGRRDWEWRYLHHLCHTELLAFGERGGAIRKAAFSPDGRWVAGTVGPPVWPPDPSQRLQVWDAADGRALFHIPPQGGAVRCFAFGPDGKRLACGYEDGAVRVWEAAAGRALIWECRPEDRPRSAVVCLAFSPDGARVASGGYDGAVRVWRGETGELLLPPIPSQMGWVGDVAFSPDGRWIAGACSRGPVRGAVKVWDARTGQLFRSTLTQGSDVQAVAFSPDGRFLASAGWDREVHVLDRASKSTFTLPGHSQAVSSLSFHPDGRTLASAGNDGTVKLWDLSARAELRTLHAHVLYAFAVSFSPDGGRLVSAGSDGLVKVWEPGTEQEMRTLPYPRAHFHGVAFSDDGALLAAADANSFEPGDKAVCVWDVRSGGPPRLLTGRVSRLNGVAFAPRGLRLATAEESGAVTRWDAATGEIVRTLAGHGGPATGVAFHPDGLRLASAGGDGSVAVWDAATGEQVWGRAAHDGAATGVAFSPGGRLLSSAGADNTVAVWDAATGEQVWGRAAHDGAATAVAFSPAGGLLASAGADGTVILWDAATGRRVRRLSGHTNGVGGVAFSPNGRRLASVSLNDRCAKIWDVGTGRDLLTLRLYEPFSVAFSPDGETLAAGDSNAVKLWDAGGPSEEERAARLKTSPKELAAAQARAFAVQGRWAEAAAAFAEGAGPNGENPAAAYQHALVLLAADDRAGYRRVCEAMLRRAGSDAEALRWLGQVCTLADGAVAEPGQVTRLLEGLREKDPQNEAALYDLSAALYRERRYEEAVQVLEKGLPDPGKAVARVCFILAMAHQRQGHGEQARQWLANAARSPDLKRPVISIPSLPSWRPWEFWMEQELLRREAEDLLGD